MTTLVEELANGETRETAFNAPAVETENARIDDLGPFRQDDVAASQSDADLTLGAVDANAPVGTVAPRSGKIVGITGRVNAAITGETLTMNPTVDGSVGTEGVVLDANNQSRVGKLAAEVPFAAGALLGIAITTTAGYTPTTLELAASLQVRWDPK